jgi:hypothetical protein
MRNSKQLLVTLLLSILVISQISIVFAITAKAQVTRMILRGDPGEEFNRHFTLFNDNPSSTTVTLILDEDAPDIIDFERTEYTILPGESVRAPFTVTAPNKPGTTDINVALNFIQDDGAQAGLVAEITVLIGSGDNDNDFDATIGDQDDNQNNDDNPTDNNNESSGFSFNPNTGGEIPGNSYNPSQLEFNPLLILSISTIVLIIVLLVIIILLPKKGAKLNSKKRLNK